MLTFMLVYDNIIFTLHVLHVFVCLLVFSAFALLSFAYKLLDRFA